MTGAGWGKVILLGEHAVVYGHPQPASGVWQDHLVWDERALIQKETHPDDPRAASGGDILLTRLMVRGVAGVVTDELALRAKGLEPIVPLEERLAIAAEKALKPDGVAVMQFNGAEAGQTIFHLHFHIIPRYVDVKLAGHGKAGKADVAELEALAARIAAAL